jgi:hypothetical protein
MKPIPDNVTLRIDIHIEISITSATFGAWSKTIDRTIYTKTGTTYTPTKPYVTITGTLINTTSGLAVQLQSYQWVSPTMSFSTPSITIYLKYQGQLVTTQTEIGKTLMNLIINHEPEVIVSGWLSKDNYGNMYIEIENVQQQSPQL